METFSPIGTRMRLNRDLVVFGHAFRAHTPCEVRDVVGNTDGSVYLVHFDGCHFDAWVDKGSLEPLNAATSQRLNDCFRKDEGLAVGDWAVTTQELQFRDLNSSFNAPRGLLCEVVGVHSPTHLKRFPVYRVRFIDRARVVDVSGIYLRRSHYSPSPEAQPADSIEIGKND